MEIVQARVSKCDKGTNENLYECKAIKIYSIVSEKGKELENL
jgi:hypothetical protein